MYRVQELKVLFVLTAAGDSLSERRPATSCVWGGISTTTGHPKVPSLWRREGLRVPGGVIGDRSLLVLHPMLV